MSFELNLCVKCGSCKALCPTYIEDVTEGMSARGRVVLLEKFHEGKLEPSKKLDERIFSCMLCGACNKLCPLGINVTDAMYEARNRLRDFNKKRRFLGLGIRLGLKKASNSFRILKFFETINEMLPVFRIYPFSAIKRMDVTLPDSALRDGMSIFRVSKPRGRIAIFAGCSVNFIYPNIGRSLIESLNVMNYDVVLPKGEVCCGAPLMGLGRREDAVEMAERNMNAFKKLNVEAVIGLCPTCIDSIKNGYRSLIGDGIDNAVEVSQFFSKLQPSAFSPQPSKVIYHDPCHSIYGLDVSVEPRQILRSMGFHLMDSERGCCGFGGTFRLLYQELSEGILEKRIEEYKRADMIVTSCPNCILQLRSRIKDRPVRHIAEVINECIRIKACN
ncbi:MAG: (Fe-S)-binding protein [Thermodesulfovibrionales bacterium]|jgi:glycolate oxidase iron-sulfur subunit|nr:(Fe-S)-binding protein [Thermodesulfovibrionales bacterium]